MPDRQTYAPVYYRTFWGYYRYWVPIAYEPGYIERERDVQVETRVFDMRTGDLVYSAVSRTLNPTSHADLVERVASRVTGELREKGFVAANANAR